MDFLKYIIKTILRVILKMCKGTLFILMVFHVCGTIDCLHYESVPELINRLDRNYSGHIRSRAADELEERGKTAIESLFNALKNENKHIRRKIPWILSGMKDSAVIEPLLYALKDSDEQVAKEAGGALQRVRKEAVEPLITILKTGKDHIKKRILRVIGELAGYERMEGDRYEENELEKDSKLRLTIAPIAALLQEKNSAVKINSLWALRRLKDPWPVELIIPLLNDNDINVRLAAIETLGILGVEQSVKAIIRLLDEKDWQVRMEAVVALGRIKNKQAVEPLIERLNDKDWRVVYRTITALSILKDERAVAPLIKMFRGSENLILKRLIIIALGEIGHEQAVKFLDLVLYYKDYALRRSAVYALGKIGKPAVETLLKTLKRSDKYVQYLKDDVVLVLGSIGDMRAFETIMGMLNHPDTDIRKSVVIALGQFKNKRAFEAIMTALDDKDGGIRSRAMEILSREKYCPAYKVIKKIAETADTYLTRSDAKEALARMESRQYEETEHFANGKRKTLHVCKCTEKGRTLFERRHFNEEDYLMKVEYLLDHTETRYAYFKKEELPKINRYDKRGEVERMSNIYGEQAWSYMFFLEKGLKMESEYKNGRYHGKVMEWNRRGIFVREEMWENGKLVKKIK